MGFQALHRLRRRSRGIAAATVALFALNWLGLALMPCAMAYALPVPVASAAPLTSDAAAPTDDDGMPPECRARMAAAAMHHDAPAAGSSGAHAAGTPSGERTCPWCLGGGPGMAAHHDTGCGSTSKPALEARDVKGSQPPLLIALSATVLAVVPLDFVVPEARADEPVLPAVSSAQDRYCRRLE